MPDGALQQQKMVDELLEMMDGECKDGAGKELSSRSKINSVLLEVS